MYITGLFNNFENRLHQLPTGLADLTSFKSEGTGYFVGVVTGDAATYKYKWNEEFTKRAASFRTQTGNVF
jgi:hypothetical protein